MNIELASNGFAESLSGQNMSGENMPAIMFRCADEDLGVIAEPVAARQVMPDWFKRLPPVDKSSVGPSGSGQTVKRCMPFLDALTFGWILSLAATVRFEVSGNGTKIDCGWDFDKEMISPHGTGQVAGHPRLPMPPMKFHNYWTIETPPGWSCLFIPPINRPDARFEIASGVVDTDSYKTLIHFPFFATVGDGVYIVEKGTPIAQVIPFRRDASPLSMRAEVRSESDAEARERERLRRVTNADVGWYRENARAPR